MSNTTNPEAWAAHERLRFIERSLWWRGQVQRKDLRALFGISLAQASSDLQRYLETNPAAARYDLKAKTYRGEPGMRCVYHAPRLEDAIAAFLPAHGDGGAVGLPRPGDSDHHPEARVAGVSLPLRRAVPRVERAAFYALWSNRCLRIDYGSLSDRRERGFRNVVPRAFAHDGYRWHLRAWCGTNGDFRDFVLSRIREAEWPSDPAPVDLPIDQDWETVEELVLCPNPELSESQRESVAWDFGMTDGVLRLSVRRAMKNYTLMHLRMPPEGMKSLPPLLVAVAPSP